MKKILFFFSGFLPLYGIAQSLLLNGGFEDENICTEYKIDCAPEAWISNRSALHNYINDPGQAYEGGHCMAIEAGHTTRPFERTFIRSQLLCGLRKGSQYRLEFFIKSPHPILDSMGVYFGSIDPLLERKPIDRLAPSLFLAGNPSNQFVKDSSWQKAVLIYTATGDEAYITIANFSRNDINGNTGIRRRNQFFVFIDNISLVPVNPAETLCANWQEVKENIYTQNERHQYLDRIIKLKHSDTLHTMQLVSTLVTVIDKLVLPDVLFGTGKKDLQPASAALLDSFCKKMAGKIIDSLVIEGHTDNTGSTASNDELSTGRARAVAAYLSQCRSFYKVQSIARGGGSRRPVAGNSTAPDRQQNRRVELLVYFRE